MARNDLHDVAARLRHHARSHPSIAHLVDQLPELPASGPVLPGLYVETTDTPPVKLNARVRVSVVRIHSVTAEGKRLVGQVQATRLVDHPLAHWEVHYYLHRPQQMVTVKVVSDRDWWLSLLEQHYAYGGAVVELTAADLKA